MKKKEFTLGLIILFSIISTAAFLGVYFSKKENNDQLKKIGFRAREEFDSLVHRKYGAYNQEGENNLTTLISIEFQIENEKDDWEFYYMPYNHLIDTNDTNIPFIATEEAVFVNKKRNLYRVLEKTFVYHMDYGWLPLAANLYEYSWDAEKKEIIDWKQLHQALIWQGDWETPFIDDKVMSLEELAK